jgi:hypothetical protein
MVVASAENKATLDKAVAAKASGNKP